jgi:hypothetical protein
LKSGAAGQGHCRLFLVAAAKDFIDLLVNLGDNLRRYGKLGMA